MRVTVLEDVCQGHTLCAATAPELFRLREEDGHAYVDSDVVPPGLEEKAERAALGCPEQAIVIEDD
jgi:ferredoxin